MAFPRLPKRRHLSLTAIIRPVLSRMAIFACNASIVAARTSNPGNPRILLPGSSRGTALRLYHVAANGIAYQFGSRATPQFLHYCSTMCLDGLDADIEQVGNLLVELAFGDQLDDLPLAGGQPMVVGLPVVMRRPMA